MSRLLQRSLRSRVFVAMLPLLLGGQSFAQSQLGQIRLDVRDSSGVALPAHGELVSQGNEFHRPFQIAADGNFLLWDIPFGIYHLAIDSMGFAPWRDTVEIRSALPVKLSVTLGLAPVTTKVQVNDDNLLVDPSATGAPVSIGHQSIRESLSSQPGREILDLAASQPGWLFESNGVLHPRGSEYGLQFVVDGQPLMQNRSPAFAPDLDSNEVESMRVLTANFPAEYGRKLGGVVEITSDHSAPLGWHGELDVAGGSFDQLIGSAALSFFTAKNQFAIRASGLHSERYLDPPVVENYSNHGNSGSGLVGYERVFGEDDRIRLTFFYNRLGYVVPNDLIQQNQPVGPQRQDASTSETGGQAYYQHSFSPELFLTSSGGVRTSSFELRSNVLSTPIIVGQNRGYIEGYLRADLAGHHGHHDWKTGSDFFLTPVHESLAYHITDPSQFDPGTQINFQFREKKWDFEPSFYIQDQVHYRHWNFSAGVRFDDYSFVVHQFAASPRLGISYFIVPWNTLVHASYDRIFQTPAMENLLLASSPEFQSVNPLVVRFPVPPAQGNFYEFGLTKALFHNFRLDANLFHRDFHNFADDDVLLQTGVSFPISYSKAHITGEEVRLSVPNWGRFSGFVSYANQSALGQGPVSGGLFIGSETVGILSNTARFAASQDQRNTLYSRVRFQAASRLWFALATKYGSGLPADLPDNQDPASLVAQFGEAVVSRVNFQLARLQPNLALDLAAGGELYHKEFRSLQYQIHVANVTDRINVVNFASLFSGTAVAVPRTVTGRLRWTF